MLQLLAVQRLASQRLAVAAALLFGCVAGNGAAIPAATALDLAIAVVGPMSGRYQARGSSQALGAQMAANDINRAGGVRLGHAARLLTLQVIDDKCSAAAASEIARKLAATTTRLVIGHGCSRATITAAKIYAASTDIIQIDPINRHRRFTQPRAGPGIFRLAGQDDLQGKIAGRFLANKYGQSRIAIVHDRTLFTMAQAGGAATILKQRGHRDIYRTTLRAGEKDYSHLVARLGASQAAAIYISSYVSETAIVTRQFFAAGHSAQFIVPDIMAAKEYLRIAGPPGNRTLITMAPRARDFPGADQVLARLKKANAANPVTALFGYAAVQIWRQAVEAAQDTQKIKLSALLGTKTFKTVLGAVNFDSSGNSNVPSYRIYKRSKDGMELVE